MTERNKKSVDKTTKKAGKNCKPRRRKNSKNVNPSSRKDSTSTPNRKVSIKTEIEPESSVSTDVVVTSGSDSCTAYDDIPTAIISYPEPSPSLSGYEITTDTSPTQTSSIESDGSSSSRPYRNISRPTTSVTKSRHPEDGKESSIIDASTIRWINFSDDPVIEAKRLEIYKANRRQRYYELQAQATAVASPYYAKVD